MKNKGCLTAIVPLIVFGCAVIGMIFLIVGGETENPAPMIFGGIFIASGVVVGAAISAILRHIEKNDPSSGSVGAAIPAAPEPVVADAAADKDESEMSDARLEAILASGIPEKRSVEALMDREDALTELMARRGMTELNEKYVEEADPLWDTYTGEYMSEAVDNLFELVYKYYTLYKERSTAREKGAETQASYTPPAAEEKEKALQNSEIEDGEKIAQSTNSESKTETDGHCTARTEAPLAPASTHSPAGRSSAAVGYKPMKKK